MTADDRVLQPNGNPPLLSSRPASAASESRDPLPNLRPAAGWVPHRARLRCYAAPARLVRDDNRGSVQVSGGALASGFALINMIASLIGGFAAQYLIGILRGRTGSYLAGMMLIATSLAVAPAIVAAFGRAASVRKAAEQPVRA